MIIAWFSCGVTSAVACKIALSLYEDVQLYYIETGSCHPDNARFLYDCEKWYGQPIHTIRSDKYTCVSDLLRKGYINGAHGAACTLELKKKVRYKLEKELISLLEDGKLCDYCPYMKNSDYHSIGGLCEGSFCEDAKDNYVEENNLEIINE